jgi:alkylation response protein AidB-like acyl-CoA dehydrogenase
MDFSAVELDEATASFWTDIRSWLDVHVTEELIDVHWRTGDGHDPSLHKLLGSQGWAIPGLPADETATGIYELISRILELELAWHHVPLTIRGTTALVLPAVKQWMADPDRTEILRRADLGELCICLGYTEPEAGSDLASIRTRATRDVGGWKINGQKMFTTGAHLCEFVFLLTCTDPGAPKHKRLTTFLVPLDSPGIEIREVQTLGGERTNMVFFDDVGVEDKYRLGPESQGWQVVHGPLNAEHRMSAGGPRPVEEEPGEAGMGAVADMSAHILRVHEPAVHAAVEWARIPGPDSRRPIDDPSVRERLAEVELGLVISKLTPGPQGRVVAADTFIQNASALVDLLGPRALLPRGEPFAVAGGWVEYAHRFAQGSAIYGGTTEVIRNLIAERFLALRRSRPKESSRQP